MRKWMVKFLSKSQSRVIKIARVNYQIYQFTLISYVLFLAMTSSRVLVFWWGHLLIIPQWFPPFLHPCILYFFTPLIDLTNTLQILNYKHTFLIANMLIIIIGLLVYNYYYFYYNYTRFKSSPFEHENLRSKVELKGISTKFFKIHFLKMCKK